MGIPLRWGSEQLFRLLIEGVTDYAIESAGAERRPGAIDAGESGAGNADHGEPNLITLD